MKKPRTAYFIFCSENRERVLAENPGEDTVLSKFMNSSRCSGLRVGDIQKIISTLWKQCPLEEKKVQCVYLGLNSINFFLIILSVASGEPGK
jgi:hypothetical protein